MIVSVLGRGGMGVVYSAYDTQLDRKLAIKLLRTDLATNVDSAEIESRLLREAQAMARLTHPNVVAVHDVGTFERRVFLAMEYVDGCTLKDWLQQPRTLKERLAVMRAAGRGLAAAHAAGLVHRDFKPDNVLVGLDGRVLVTDFGLARAEGEQVPEAPLRVIPAPSSPDVIAQASSVTGKTASSLESPLTMTGSILGTVGYMAPEQAFGETTNASTDQFSYAATLYLALYGEKPFEADALGDYLVAVESPVRDPPKGSEVPLWMRRIILRGLAHDPVARYPSLDAFLRALDEDPAIAWRRRAWSAAGVLLVALGVLGGVLTARRSANECAFDPGELGGVWDNDVRAHVEGAFKKSHLASASANLTLIESKLDELAGHWGDMRQEVCQATRIRKTQPEDVYALRMACLDRQRTSLRSVSNMLSTADDQVVKKSLDVAYGLPQLAWCADVPTLRASAGLPDDPTTRASVLAIRTELAESHSLSLAGKDKEAAALAHSAAEHARKANHAATLAEALLREGEAMRLLGAFAEAEPLLRDAAWGAVASGADSIAVEAATHSAFVVGAKLRKPELAHFWLASGHATLDRMGSHGGELEMDLLQAEAAVHGEAEWHPEEAVPLEEKVVVAYRARLGVHPKTAHALYSLGVDYSYLGEFDKARPLYEESLGMNETIGGPEFIETARSAYALGDALVALGDFKAGDALLARAVATFDKLQSPYWGAITLQAATRSFLRQGDAAQAARTAAQSLDLLEKSHNTGVLVPIVSSVAAEAFMASGRWGEALPLCDRSVSEQEKTGGLDPEKAYGWDALRCKGDALLGEKRPEEAIPFLERSITMKRRMYPADLARAQLSLAHALHAVHRDPERVRQLLQSSRAELARYPFLTVDRDHEEGWATGEKI